MPTRAEIGRHLELSASLIQERIGRGILPSEGTLDDYRRAELRYLRGRAAGHVSEDGLDLTAERARLAKEQADRLAMENAEARGESARWEDVEAVLLPTWSGAVQRLLAVPAQAAPDANGAATIAESQAVLQRYQHDALHEVADALAHGAASLRRRIADAGRERRRRLRLRAAPAEPDDGKQLGGGAAAGPARNQPRARRVAEPPVPAGGAGRDH